MYSVVEFLQTQEVELVPAQWISDGHCYWPGSLRGMALHLAIKNRTEPEDSWDQWEVRTLFTTESYEEGRRKAREAEMTSDLLSEAEACGQRPRRKKKRVQLGPPGGLERVESEEDRPSPPTKNLPAPAPIIQPPSMPVTPLPIPQPMYTDLSTNSGPPPPVHYSEMLQSWEPVNEMPSLPSHHTYRWAPQQSEPALLKEVLTKLEMVLDQQSTILRLLQHQVAPGPGVEQIEGLPLQNLVALQNLEQSLQSPDYKEKMINYLGAIGGADVKDTTWRVLKKLISNTLAKSLNWRGVNGKTSVAGLNLREVIIAAVRRNPIVGVVAEAEVEQITKRWLQLATDREGGRKRRLLEKERMA
ncbi:uncharacterized protein LOC114453560 [Parambassis ranga]|uniref:Uncharacterized protein LOC114430716 n=1 Tax=Parambassis ranga TaxID=210632 RepID=A0A6P7HR66_9TELE|nr:uncharacterized protein LOC114430716 [Parambassis ranga]XP_028281083.1 uncharacterized protein LOC114448364 [Parambassis ranga]XP_028283324.1 uncharacterized protein LOC114449702 [Parambassis ranga]XP_028288550.1 uncharacterized protein LOC114453062 [Parambassis ranga]XP_028289313.1 uncharacterized protein LOC114453560 [Parambassis ranga]